jgi:hypothetical protein
MPAFGNLNETAEAVADAEYERVGSQAVGEDPYVDMGELAERAHDRGLAFYEIMSSLRQSTLNLFAAGMYHLLEQQLADLCRDGAFTIAPPNDTKLEAVRNWYEQHFELNLGGLAAWPKIDELRLIANTVKHGEGHSAQRLREVRAELFEHPLVKEVMPSIAGSVGPIGMPLAGDDLYVTEEGFQE